MIIDAHAHICPDHLAARSAELFFEQNKMRWLYDGTVGGLIEVMDRAGIDKALVVNVVISASVVPKANDWTASQVARHPDRLIGMAIVHPGQARPELEVERCARELGFKAVKLHCALLKFFPDDPRIMPVYELAQSIGLTVMAHCGPNVENFAKSPQESARERQFSEPANWRSVLGRFPSLKIILAHLAGATHYWDDALYLIERHPNLYVDTSMCIDALAEDRLQELIRRRGAARVVFGSDYPAFDAVGDLLKLRALPLIDEEKRGILGLNAAELLGIGL